MEWKRNPSLYPPYLRARIRKGLGTGAQTKYRAWRNLRNSGNVGTAGFVHGIRVARRYEIPDTRKRTYFYLLERVDEIVDIRELWPILDLNRTLRLAQDFGVNHPLHGIFPEPVIVDFLITEKCSSGLRFRAVSLVPRAADLKRRDQSLMRIQQQWCIERGIEWTLVETDPLDRTVLDSLRFIRSWYRHRYVADSQVTKSFADCFMSEHRRDAELKQLINSTARRMRLDPQSALDVFRYCAWSHQIPVSLTSRIAPNCPLVLNSHP